MSLADKPGFKETELGWFSNEWLHTTLGGACSGRLQTGPFGSQLHADEYQDEGIPVLMPKDLICLRGNLASAAKVSSERAAELARHKLKTGDLLFSRRGDVTRFALIDSHSEGALCGTGCLRATPSADHIPAFLAHFLQLNAVKGWLQQNAVGQTMPNMNTRILAALPLVLPPSKAEQQKIAAILTAMDDKLDVITRQIEATQTLKQGLMQTLFSRGVGTQDANGRWVPHAEFKDSELGEIPAAWEAAKLNSHVSKVGSGVTPKGGSDSYLSSGIPLIRSQNVLVGRLSLDDVVFISSEQHEKMRNSALSPNDVLLNITGASIGRCAVLPADFEVGNVNQHVCIIRTDATLSPHFLCQYLNSEMGQKQVDKFQAGGNREGLNYQQIRSFDVPLPPVTEQHEIALALGSIDEKTGVLTAKLEQYQTLKRGLMQKLLTGEWRVNVDASAAGT